MKTFYKVFFISLASLLFVFIAVVSLVLWYVFTPEKLTPIVRSQTEKFITCPTEIGQVELTFFSTFPQFGLQVNKLTMINPMNGAQNDTLLNVDQFVGVVDVMALWQSNELKLSDISLLNGTINAFTDATGNTNYNIIVSDSLATTEPETDTTFGFIDLGNIELKNVSVTYIDQSMYVDAAINNMWAKMNGVIYTDSIVGQVDISKSNLLFDYREGLQRAGSETGKIQNPDSLVNLSGAIAGLSAKISGAMYKDSIISHVVINQSDVSLTYNDVKYLQNTILQLDLPFSLNLLKQRIRLNHATATVNNLALAVNGSVENDTINKIILTDVDYDFKSWPVKEIIALIPHSYLSYLDGIDADGLLTSNGTITGIYSETSMPLLDIHLQMTDGKLKHKDFPVPMYNIDSDLDIYTDLKNNQSSYVTINRFSANTPKSTIKTAGTVNNLFSDVIIKLSTDANLSLEEFNPVIPANMKTSMKGNVQGRVKSEFSMEKVQKMQLEKMKLSGNLAVTNLDVVYDSLWVKTDQSQLEFSLPNHYAASNNTKFAFVKIIAGHFDTGKLDGYHASLTNADISFETSDARDSTRIPHLICTFKMDSLAAGMDTISLAIQKPVGKVSLAPGVAKDQPKISVIYKSNKVEAAAGDLQAKLEKLNLDTEIINDNSQTDIFLQWMVKGFINMDQGLITTPDLKYPMFIPDIQMEFEPEKFIVKESRIVISNSDFELTGKVDNVLSYFRGDSLLRGDFSFTSNSTDVQQLMNLTSGIGNESEPDDKPESGPYMVPKGVDVFIRTNIKQAKYLESTASDINGSIRVKDGILVLDELKFTTPAAKMQLTAMYRTPRKNHIYMGLDYHLMDIEIAELLNMIPEIDSLMPMLRSFGGKGEFHMAVETYMDSTYTIKKSTLQGASSISGQDLVLMDGETFSTIAKKLRFKKKTQNRVKKLFAEFTIFRDEIEVYPFLIEMDKYSAIIGGVHYTDLTFIYEISVVESPLPFRLRLNIKGDMDDFATDLGRSKYAKNYRPAARGEVAKKQLELRKLIRDALMQRVR